MEQNRRYEELEKYGTEFKTQIEKSFGIKIQNLLTTASSFLYEPIDFDARFPKNNVVLKGTTYYYDKSTKLIHFTSLPKLLSIINEGSLRMYNLHNSNDSKEYSFAAELFNKIYRAQGLPEDWIINEILFRKENSFITSCTATDNLNIPIFWEKYADNKQGVAIEFEVLNSLDYWEGFYLSNVHYDSLYEFENLLSEWTKLQIQNQNNFYRIKMDQILSLHKSKDWSHEKEVRLLTFSHSINESLSKILIFNDAKFCSPINVNVKYFKLPLCDDNNCFINSNYYVVSDHLWNTFPKLKISDIFFGPDFQTDNDFYQFQIDLRNYIFQKMHCWLNIFPKERTTFEYGKL